MRVWIAQLSISDTDKTSITDVDAFYSLSDAVDYYRDIYSDYVEVLNDEYEDMFGVVCFYIRFKDNRKDYKQKVDIWFKPVTLDWSHKKPRLKPNEED